MAGSCELEKPLSRLEYRAIGLIKAKYIPGDADPNHGLFQTADGNLFPVVIFNKSLLKLLQNEPDLLTNEQIWTVYPKTMPEMRFQARHLRRLPEQEDLSADTFSLRGVVLKQRDDSFVVQIKRNFKQGEDPSKRPKAFNLLVFGRLPRRAIGQFWEFTTTRIEKNLILKEARFIAMVRRTPQRPFAHPKA
ncbi:MAG: hypothetical protein SFT81_05500 [Candidatus Caenarcaniphilales bacterium]|nr:hypothetical protein [Candidatus Caenarcaniphilales bacterium]